MLKKGHLLASNFGSVLSSEKVTQRLLKKVLGKYNLSRVQAVNWGINNETSYKKDLKGVTGLSVEEESGVWLDLSGILGDGVKCPCTHRQNIIDEAIQTKCLFIKKTHMSF